MDGRAERILRRGRLTCHCVVAETDSGLVLLDTGFGLRDIADPEGRLSRFFLALLRPEFREEMTAVRQIASLGLSPRDVRHIVLTHMDFDHAGGLDDFPWARVHVLARERQAARAQRTLLDRMRYRPRQWSGISPWNVYEPERGERWFGFECVRALAGIPAEILLVPLVGHTLGHSGIAVARPQGWLLLAGDAYFHHREMHPERPWCTPGLRLYQWVMEKDRRARLGNQARLRELIRSHGREVDVVCSHDVAEFERLSGRSAALPASAFEKPLDGSPGE
jgi:glyoxylase-like metal-dependent hydrolase (beta-lactamase superfamily II)